MQLPPHVKTVFCKASMNLSFYSTVFPNSLNPRQERSRCKRSPATTFCHVAAQPFRNTVHQPLLMAAAHREPAAPSGSLAKRHVHPQGWLCVSVLWMVVSEATSPTETIKSTVIASGQNKESFFSYNSATFGLSESQKTRTADKGNSTGHWRENKLREKLI